MKRLVDFDKFKSICTEVLPTAEAYTTLGILLTCSKEVKEKIQKILYFDLDGVLADYEKAAINTTEEDRKQPGFFLNLPLMEGAKECFNTLYEHFDVYFLSTAPWSNHHSNGEKRLWIENHFGDYAFKRLILTHHKNLLKGDFLIDDRVKNGAGDFEGEHIHYGTKLFPNLKIVTEYLLNNK